MDTNEITLVRDAKADIWAAHIFLKGFSASVVQIEPRLREALLETLDRAMGKLTTALGED